MMNYPKVRIIRANKREGLIRARLLGAAAAKAPVLTYLDSHCECTEGWLEPLLDRIARDPTTVVCPVIDVIDDTTLEYHWRDSGGVNVGGFDWNLQVNEIFVLLSPTRPDRQCIRLDGVQLNLLAVVKIPRRAVNYVRTNELCLYVKKRFFICACLLSFSCKGRED